MPRNWGDPDLVDDQDGGPVVIALVMATMWGFVLGWVAHMVIF